MSRSRAMAAIEEAVYVTVGHGLAVLGQLVILPVHGLSAGLGEPLRTGALVTLVPLARSCLLRRRFDALGRRGGAVP